MENRTEPKTTWQWIRYLVVAIIALGLVWWMLRVCGFDQAAVLNGGWHKWTMEGRPVSTDPCSYPPARFMPRLRPALLADTREVLAEFDYEAVEDALGYRKGLPVGIMEGLAVDHDWIWLVTDNNEWPRRSSPGPVSASSPRWWLRNQVRAAEAGAAPAAAPALAVGPGTVPPPVPPARP